MSPFMEIFMRLLREEVPSGDLAGVDDEGLHGIYTKTWVEYIQRVRNGCRKTFICPLNDAGRGPNRMDDMKKEMDELLGRNEGNSIPIVCLPPKEGERCSD